MRGRSCSRATGSLRLKLWRTLQPTTVPLRSATALIKLAGPAHPGFSLASLFGHVSLHPVAPGVSTTVVISSACVTGVASASPRHSLLTWASNGLRAAARAASPSPRRLGFRDASPSPQRRVARDGSPKARKHGAPDASRVPSDGTELDLRQFSAFGCDASPILGNPSPRLSGL